MKVGAKFIPHGLFNGIFIPDAILAHPRLQLSSKVIFGKLTRYAGKDGVCYPRIDSIAVGLGTSKRTVQRGIKELVKEGFLEIEKTFDQKTGSQKSNRYYFLWHDAFESNITRKDVVGAECQNDIPGNDKKSPLGVTKTSSPPYAKMTSKKNQSLKENQKETTTYCGGCVLSEKVEKAIEVIAPTKRDPEAWAAKIMILAKNGGLDEELLFSQANSIQTSSVATHRELVEEIVRRDGYDAVSGFVSSVKTPLVTLEGVPLDVFYVKKLLARCEEGYTKENGL